MSARFKKCAILILLLSSILCASIVNAANRSQASSDAAFANFRNVRAGSIGSNNLYRSQHPANGSSRSWYANRLMKQHGVNTVLNLSDSKTSLQKYFSKKKISTTYYYRTLYSRGSVYTAHMNLRFSSSTFRKKVVSSLKFMASHKGPYLVHCEIGQDRTGFVILVLESLMGAPYNYMLEDFAKSYMNMHNYSYAKSKKKAVTRLNEDLSIITGRSKKTNWSKLSLPYYAAKYLKKGGMTDGEIAALKKNLSLSYSSTGTPSATAAAPSNKETPAYRNLSIGGKTILTKSIKAGTKLTCTYKLKSGDVKTYPVECVNSNKSVVKVESCKNGNLTISALKKGTAVITLRSKKDHSKRVLLTINVK